MGGAAGSGGGGVQRTRAVDPCKGGSYALAHTAPPLIRAILADMRQILRGDPFASFVRNVLRGSRFARRPSAISPNVDQARVLINLPSALIGSGRARRPSAISPNVDQARV
eukprot:4417866-Prymnesium_polylepis.1